MKRLTTSIVVGAVVLGFGISHLANSPVLTKSGATKHHGPTTKRINESKLSTLTKECGSSTVFVKFYADWCGPCRYMKPLFDRVSSEVDGAMFYEINVDDIKLPNKLSGLVKYIPTILVLKDGQVVNKLEGSVPYGTLKKFIESNL